MPTQPDTTGAAGGRLDGSLQRAQEFGVDLYGQMDLMTGLGRSSRGFAQALIDAGVPVHLVPLGRMYEGLTRIDPSLPSDPRRFPLTIEHVNADTTERFLWHFGDEVAGARARVAVWYWELAALRPDWVANTRHYDEIWVASRFGQRAVSAVTNVPVAVVSPPVALPAGNGDVDGLRFGIADDAFVFLYVFDYSSYVDRKNPRCLLDAFLAEFADAPEIVLVLKVSHADPESARYARLSEMASAHRNVRLMSEMLDDASLSALFTRADCYVSPHRSEGFGLTVAEAMLRRCPVIATDYGSTTDFVTDETAYPLEYTLVEIEQDQGPYLHGYVWADPSREHLQQLMRRVVADPAAAGRKAEAGRRLVLDEYSHAAVGRRMLARLQGLYERCAHV